MQGKKHCQPKLFTTFYLAIRIPENNFCRQLKSLLNLHHAMSHKLGDKCFVDFTGKKPSYIDKPTREVKEVEV